MAKKVILKDENSIEILPITRGELILDSSGKQAFRSNEFLATNSQPGLMSHQDKTKLDSLSSTVSTDPQFNPTSISLNKDWKASGFILNEGNGFQTGVYIIKIMSGNLMFSGTASVVIGKITVEDEIMLHMSGIPQVYADGTQGRIYAKIAPSATADYGEIYLATNVPQSAITNLSITMKKII